MTNVYHSIQFVTEVDETNPTGMRLLQLEESMRVEMLESMLKEMLLPIIQPEVDRINEGGSWAILKVVE